MSGACDDLVALDADGDGRERPERGTLRRLTRRGVVDRAVAGAVELGVGRRDHALLVRADGAEGDDLAGGRLREQRLVAADLDADAPADGHIGEGGHRLAVGGRSGAVAGIGRRGWFAVAAGAARTGRGAPGQNEGTAEGAGAAEG